MIDNEKLAEILSATKDNMEIVEEISMNIIREYTSDLDDFMRELQEQVILKDNPSDTLIEKYFLELTNALYFVSSKTEYFGFYEDLSKTNLKDKYNKAYSDKQIEAASQNKKITIADTTVAAEQATLTESITSMIYIRSFRVIKAKIEAAQEMVKTLSKILTRHMQEQSLSTYGQGSRT